MIRTGLKRSSATTTHLASSTTATSTRVYRHIYYCSGAAEAEDLTAMTFLKAWEAIERYPGARSSLRVVVAADRSQPWRDPPAPNETHRGPRGHRPTTNGVLTRGLLRADAEEELVHEAIHPLPRGTAPGNHFAVHRRFRLSRSAEIIGKSVAGGHPRHSASRAPFPAKADEAARPGG